jgi:putative two-component system response regulator
MSSAKQCPVDSGLVLIVDDQPEMRRVLTRFLEAEGYRTAVAGNGQEALDTALRCPPDLILLDVTMPVLGGLETCRRLKSDERTALIPVTILTGADEETERTRGIEAGADDFLSKPFDSAQLRARLRAQLRLKRLLDQLERTESVLFAMAKWVECRDHYTEAHLRRVAGYSEQIARALGLAMTEVRTLRYAGILHDVGKIGVPDAILHKPGGLLPEERVTLEKHAAYGADIVSPLRFAPLVGPIIRSHHEWWDGRGYPERLHEDGIPLGGRIVAVVDAWDAMTTDRPYRRALSEREAARRLEHGAGSQWDPRLVDVFLTLRGSGRLAPLGAPDEAIAA